MTRQVINPDQGTPPKVPLSPAVKAGNLVFVSGMPAWFGDRQIAKGDFPAQMHQVMKNLQTVLAAAGTSLDQVVKMNVILVRKSDWDDMNRIYREYFKEGNFPARTTIICALANSDFLLEIECVAEAGPSGGRRKDQRGGEGGRQGGRQGRREGGRRSDEG